MEVVIFCGIQATGKSSFYKQNFFKTHVHISMDLLKTRNRENRFIDLCLDTEQSFVIDNTNPSRDDRVKYIQKIREKRDCKLICYYFQSKIEDALNRNTERTGKERIPDVGIKATFNKLELPSFDEGFDEIYYVELIENKFIIKNWEI